MSIVVTATVTIRSAPTPLDEDLATTTVFPVADAQVGQYAEQSLRVDRLAIGDVVCRGELARAALHGLREGDRIIVMGALELRVPLDVIRDDSPSVLLTIEASEIGLALST